MKFETKFRADSFVYPAEIQDSKKIIGEVQKRTKDLDIDKDLKGMNDREKSNYILSIYAFVAYDEGYRKGLQEIKKTNSKIQIKKRSKSKFQYQPDNYEEITKLTRKRSKSKRMIKARNEHCQENNIENTEESFMLSMVIHTFFEAGYTDVVVDTNKITEHMYPEDSERAVTLNNIVDEVLKKNLN